MGLELAPEQKALYAKTSVVFNSRYNTYVLCGPSSEEIRYVPLNAKQLALLQSCKAMANDELQIALRALTLHICKYPKEQVTIGTNLSSVLVNIMRKQLAQPTPAQVEVMARYGLRDIFYAADGTLCVSSSPKLPDIADFQKILYHFQPAHFDDAEAMASFLQEVETVVPPRTMAIW